MFQSRNRESSNFNRLLFLVPLERHGSFNLVIENLLISTSRRLATTRHPVFSFQSRNRESSNFNQVALYLWRSLWQAFQSRNRESSNFNSRFIKWWTRSRVCFNLVIENLLISTLCRRHTLSVPMWSFNLVIENLLISTRYDWTRRSDPNWRFNLVIENLLISTLGSSSGGRGRVSVSIS